ncbi:MAG: hypothetical protein J1E16_02560 [Muribaculaceae bacterium]|nr:hypothetical protein [Muribaculaceae bacterium]
MFKKYIYSLSFLSIVFLTACSDNEPSVIEEPDKDVVTKPSEDPEEGEEPGDVDEPQPGEIVATNLSENEMANCYIIQSPGKYKFLADNQFNLGEGLPVPRSISPVKADLLWQTRKNSIPTVDLVTENEKPYVVFEVTEAEGNAVIYVENANGDIEWSWHIWMPSQDIEALPTSTGYEVMNMNLGALNNIPGDPNSYGMLYQWGRKDPMPASATLTGDTSTLSAPMYDINGNEVKISNSDWSNTDNNTIDYSISHPLVCLSNYAQYATSRDWLKDSDSDNSLWGNPEGDLKDEENNYVNLGVKTCYDPSPAGWRVAPADVFRDFTTTGGYAWDLIDFNVKDINEDHILDLEDYNYGWHFYINGSTALYFPAASRFDGSYAMLMGSMSGY